MKKNLLKYAGVASTAALVFFVQLSACDPSDGPQSATPANAANTKTGSMATDFTTRDVDGKTFRLSDLLGKKVVLIDFWATWCQPCLAEMPHLQRMYEQYKAKGFVLVAISMDGPETISEVPSFAKRNNMNFTVLLDEDSQVASVYNPHKSAPLSVLIDREGHVVKVHEGYNPGDEDTIAAELASLMAPSEAASPSH